jgi:hypothetical protein
MKSSCPGFVRPAPSVPPGSRMASDMMQKLAVSVVIAALVTVLSAAAVHHHGDEACHADCALCLFLIQPAVADAGEDSFVCGLPVSPENPPVSEGSLASLCFRAASLGRAPPFRRG